MRKTRASNLFEYHCVTTVEKNRKRFFEEKKSKYGKALNIIITLLCTYVFNYS